MTQFCIQSAPTPHQQQPGHPAARVVKDHALDEGWTKEASNRLPINLRARRDESSGTL
jgi:hypothetical protein